MRILVLLAALAQAGNISYVYPVRVQIVQATHDRVGRGSGFGNIIDPLIGEEAFEYRYQGCRHIDATDARGIPARWGSAVKLIVLVAPYDQVNHECQMFPEVHKDFIWVIRDGMLAKAAPPKSKK